jgi:hypothetical protein
MHVAIFNSGWILLEMGPRGLSRSPSRHFKQLLLDPGGGFLLLILKRPHGGFRSETAVEQPLQKRGGYKFITVMSVTWVVDRPPGSFIKHVSTA